MNHVYVNKMRAIILAGGKGTRLAPFTDVFPKPLVPMGERPILDIIIRQLKHYGFRRITLAVGHMADLIQTYFKDGQQYGIKIDYSFEDRPLGTAGPLALIGGLEESFLVMNADLLTNLDFNALVHFHKNQEAIATIGTYQKKVEIDLGIIKTDGSRIITDYIEKPTYQYAASMGVYIFEPEVLRFVKPQKYLDFPELVKRLLESGQRVVSYPFEGYWLDIGRHEDYQRASEEFKSMKGSLNLD